jgi:hypothetical protein
MLIIYGCSLADKRTSETSRQGVLALKPENAVEEENTFYQKILVGIMKKEIRGF